MNAVVITGHGGPETVAIAQIPAPRPGPGEVLLRVEAASLNHLELWVIQGGRAKLDFPHTIGSDAYGVVVETGTGVSNLAVGDRVVANPGVSCGACARCRAGEESECASFTIRGLGRAGTFAEFAAVPASSLAPAPAHLSPEEASTLGIAPLTAYRMLFSRARLQAGEKVLIHGAGGGVALFALLFARAAGAEVFVTSSSEEKIARAKSLGAAGGIHYNAPDPAGQLRALVPKGFDVAFDTAGAATLRLSFAVLRKGGRIVTCGVTRGAEAEINLQALYWNSLSLLGSTMGSRRDFAAMLSFVAENMIRPPIDCVFPLARAREALERLAAGTQFGKIVLRTREADVPHG